MATYTLSIAGRQVEVPVDEPVATPEETAWLTDIEQGISDRQDAELAAQVAAMDGNAYARFRREHGIGGPDLVSFLAGN